MFENDKIGKVQTVSFKTDKNNRKNKKLTRLKFQ